MTQPTTTIDAILSPSLIELAKQRARAAVVRTRSLEVEAEAIAERSVEMLEANHLTEHLSKLLTRGE